MHAITVTLAILFELLGIVETGRAIVANNRATGLTPLWREDLRRLAAKFRKPTGQVTEVGAASAIAMGSESYVRLGKGPLGGSIEDRLARLENNLEQARNDLVKEWQARSLEDNRIRREMQEATAEIRREMKASEKAAKTAERQALDYELWGLIYIAVGVIFGVLATLTS